MEVRFVAQSSAPLMIGQSNLCSAALARKHESITLCCGLVDLETLLGEPFAHQSPEFPTARHPAFSVPWHAPRRSPLRPRARSALHQQVIRRVGQVALAERTGLKGSEDDEDDEGTEDEGNTTARWRI